MTRDNDTLTPPTPLTDDQVFRADSLELRATLDAVPADFARDLEARLAAYKASHASQDEHCNRITIALEKARQERDTALQQLAEANARLQQFDANLVEPELSPELQNLLDNAKPIDELDLSSLERAVRQLSYEQPEQDEEAE